MKFGVFDHLDVRDEPLGRLYDDRLKMVAAYEAADFYAYHIAEHHATPLGASPSPNVFLAAVARATSRIRLGPLVYLLPLYHPLRLIEEICMVDQLSGGRLDVGVGRGVSPYEVGAYGVLPDDRAGMFEEALGVLIKGLSQDRLSHEGEHYQIPDIPMVMRPVQRPYPPLWYGGANESGARFSAAHGMNFTTLGSTERVKGLIASYSEIWAETAGEPLRDASPVKSPLIGVGRHIFVAETDEEAMALARPAYEYWWNSVTSLWREHNASPVTGMMIDDFDEACRIGVAVVGSPATVRAALEEQADEIPFNYLLGQFSWGCLTHDQEMQSFNLFKSEIMPALAER